MHTVIPSVKELRKICQTAESAKHDSILGRYFGRKLSIYLTHVLLHTPISANQVTILMLLVGMVSGTLFIIGNYWCSLAGSILFPIMYILDGVDGEVARYRNSCSLKGVYLDRVSHIITYPFLFIGITFGVYINNHDIRVFIFGFLATYFFTSLLLVDLEKSKISGNSKPFHEPDGVASILVLQKRDRQFSFKKINRYLLIIFRLLFLPGFQTVDLMMILFLIGSLFNNLYLILIIFGTLIPLRWIAQITFDLKHNFHSE